MITNLEIRGFKRFERQSFSVAPLTVLAGLNGSGKTSVVQALLLAWEASSDAHSTVCLNGPFGLELGTAEDVRNWNAGDQIEIVVDSNTTGSVTYRFAISSDAAQYLVVQERPATFPLAFSMQPRAFSYLCAERLGPRNTLGASPLPDDKLEVGARGEHCAQILSILGDKPIEDGSRLHPDREQGMPALLKYEVERWLSEIARPVEINAESYAGAMVTSLRFRSPGGEWVRAPNMGFGVSYALPIVLGGLSALSGGLLIVENPEAHLHPAGQSRMGVFLAWLAGRGVQIILETHSDHVLNGIRRAIGEYKYLTHDQAAVNYFESHENEILGVSHLKFTSIGGVSDWPRGFFDQYQIDVASLGRVRRQR